MLEDKAETVITGISALLPLIVSHALNVIGAIVILLVGLWLAGKVQQWVVAALGRARHFDAMLKGFFGSIARYLVLTITALAVLSQFGIQTTSLIAVIGAAGLAIGLALQGTLSNLAAGIMLLIFRPFRVGHKVQVGGNTGTVRELSLFWTELVTDDKVLVIVPNSGVWGQALRKRDSSGEVIGNPSVAKNLGDVGATAAGPGPCGAPASITRLMCGWMAFGCFATSGRSR